jgi:ATP-dependent helicase HepA
VNPASTRDAPWKPGHRIRHRFNPDLGPGLVRAIEGRTIVVHFPGSDTELRLAADSDAIEPLRMEGGSRAVVLATHEMVVIAGYGKNGNVLLRDGREIGEAELWPVDVAESPVQRLARGDVDSIDAFSLRLDALHLAAIREADGLGSFLGGRIRLFPHQLYAAERATRTDPVRWLLADEVGLGKTVEACLVLDHLLRTGRADRTLVVAPETLTIQWLGELWRKYHQVFVLLDDARLGDVEKDYGRGFNPFDAHRRVVVGLDFLVDRPWLTAAAVDAGIDLLIVDEAHHLRRSPGHPGNRKYRAVQPISALGRHVLLLTATPLEEDAFGFFRLLQLLRPEEFPEDRLLAERLESGEPLPPCTSATRRVDVGGLPPRQPTAIDLGSDPGWADLDELEAMVGWPPALDPVARKKKLNRIRRTLASGAALEAVLGPGEKVEQEVARRAVDSDPRLAWLARQAPKWRRAGDKTLVFAAERETLEAIKAAMSHRAHMRVGVFHEDLSPAQRDIEVAQFRLPSGPSMLVSTECGGEGRNFEFCTRLVHFDLPWNPMAVEQRIGRLDRIGRELPVEILYFLPHSTLARAVAELYDRLGLFRRPMAGLEKELAGVESAVEELALSGGEDPRSDLREVSRLADNAYERIQEAAQRELHRDPYRPEMADSILGRVPDGLEELMSDVVLSFAEIADLHVEEHRAGARHSIELGHRSLVEGLPGVPAGSGFLGTFDREEAMRDESIDFFASGHPLVEGVLAHIEDSPLGRVGLLHGGRREGGGLGLLAIYKHGPRFEAVAVDSEGRRRPDWAGSLTRRPLRSRRVNAESWTSQPGWDELVHRLASSLDDREQPVAVAIFRFD